VDTLAPVPALTASLDRHQERREAGLPTISVLRGAVGLSVQRARLWAEDQGRGVVVLAGDDPRLDALIDAWADALAGGHNLIAGAITWLARRLERPADELGQVLDRTTPLERATFLAVSLQEETVAAVACRWLLTQPDEAARKPGLASRLAAALGGASRERVFSALCALIPPDALPIFLLVPPAEAGDRIAWIGRAAASLARLAEAEPRLPLFLAIEPEELDRYHTIAPESRARTLVRAGTVTIPALDGPEISRRLDAAVPGAATALAASVRRLAADGASDRLVELFLEAACATAAVTPETEHDDRARSAAERFLFDRLDTLPATAGKFRLNTRLDFPFGNGQTIEVDLAAPELALALEIDGYYHFHDADAYRRDRRKDLELQKHGFLVMRVLADDVVRRLEEVLDQILAAVASRRGHHSQGPSS
jgi:very-short-patch-repair endonuclease